MERKELFELLKKVESGQMTAEQGMQDMSLQPDMLVGNYADIDLHRHIRQGMPEVIYGEGKTAEQILGIAAAMKKKDIGRQRRSAANWNWITGKSAGSAS